MTYPQKTQIQNFSTFFKSKLQDFPHLQRVWTAL